MNSLRGRVRLLTTGLTVVLGLISLLAVSRVRVLERAVTEVLSRNYRSIEAMQGSAEAIAGLQLAVHDRRCQRRARACVPTSNAG